MILNIRNLIMVLNSFHQSLKAFMHSACRSFCPRSNTRNSLYTRIFIQLVKIKYKRLFGVVYEVWLIVHLQAYSKELRYNVVFGGKSFADYFNDNYDI